MTSMKFISAKCLVVAVAMTFALAVYIAYPTTAAGQAAVNAPQIPPKKDNDLKFYAADGKIVKGREALEKMPSAGLVLWLAGNQFFAMDDVIASFRKKNVGTSVALITLPPGLLLQAIKAGGWIFEGKEYRGLPDVYASVNLGHLKDLKKSGLMDSYMIYMHNELQIMVAKGNPKKIVGIKDLGREDIRTSMPNPINEGIMQFYARKVLERHDLWQQISAGKECVSCDTTKNNWFTAVHHRETPDRIKANQSDAGIVWKTEALEALREGANVDAITLPAEDSLRNEVSYVIGVLGSAAHRQAGEAFLGFLRTSEGQDAYAKFGFVKADGEELKMKPIN
ncbi:MAG: substrate-binding domain-containing protein [Rhizobiales bacterium]|nr:substrate-binding domain-containing protein [Hyphomicrobiales bacterium]